MIAQLVQQLAQQLGVSVADAQGIVLTADPLDLVWRMEQVWDAANIWGQPPAGPARRGLFNMGAFANVPLPAQPAWDHLIYAYALENTRAAQILARVVHAFRSGEGLGIPSVATQRWLDATETLLFNAAYPVPAWLSTSAVRPDAEAVRRNAYYRMFGMDLAFGTDANAPYPYDKAQDANKTFVQLFEELLFELWRAIENIRNLVANNTTDDDRIYRLSQELGFILRSRRINGLLAREELAAVTAMGWVELTVSSSTPVVTDLRAQAASPADRLKAIGERVQLMPHSRADSFFAMDAQLSLLLRALEAGWVTDSGTSWLLYQSVVPTGVTLPPNTSPLGTEVRRVITEWAAASGHDLKSRAVPITVMPATKAVPAKR